MSNSLLKTILFELKSFIGRNIIRSYPKVLPDKNYLNLGSSNIINKNFINADFYFFYDKKEKKFVDLDWQLDLRFPLKCENQVFDGVFTEHTLEHLNFNDASNLVKELHRIMKTGAYLRITVPDLSRYIHYYLKQYDEIQISEFDRRFSSGCSAIRSLTQNYGHLSVWDFEELKSVLKQAGFTDIKQMAFGKSQDPQLNMDLIERSWETLYVEAKK